MNAENFLEGASARLLFLDHITIIVNVLFIAVAILKVLTWSPHHFYIPIDTSLPHYHHHHHLQSTSMSLVCIQSLIFWYPLKYCSVQYKAYTTEQNNYLWFIRSTELKGSLLLGYFIHWRGLWVYTKKHCQRHNGPEGWVHITSSYTNLDQSST